MDVSDNTILAERLGDFIKNLGKKGLDVSTQMARKVLKNPGRAWDTTANILQQLQVEILKRYYQRHLRFSISIIWEKDYTWVNSYNLCYINCTKNTKTISISTTEKQRVRTKIREKIK